MLNYDDLFALDPFVLDGAAKRILYKQWLHDLERHHMQHCNEYARFIRVVGEGAPLPVRLFKEFDLLSSNRDDIIKTMTSSGTTGQSVSRIYLDRSTSARQTKALAKIVGSFTGKDRPPLLVIDSRAVLKNRSMFSARGAGILGFSMLGRDVTYALDEDMQLDLNAIESFYVRHSGEKVMLFGFTFMIWQFFCQALRKKNICLDLSGTLIHGGGWKKLIDEAVNNDVFKQVVREACGITSVCNYYGMVEQTGSVFMECECGHLHASIFSDIDILDPFSLKPLKNGVGVIQCTSLLPTSYPGHVLLTEDEGKILGEDTCPCGRKGKYFTVFGRIKGAEIRGCSDTYEKR